MSFWVRKRCSFHAEQSQKCSSSRWSSWDKVFMPIDWCRVWQGQLDFSTTFGFFTCALPIGGQELNQMNLYTFQCLPATKPEMVYGSIQVLSCYSFQVEGPSQVSNWKQHFSITLGLGYMRSATTLRLLNWSQLHGIQQGKTKAKIQIIP